MSQQIWLIKTATVPPKTKITVRVFTTIAVLCCLQSHLRAAVRQLTLIAQGIMYVIRH